MIAPDQRHIGRTVNAICEMRIAPCILHIASRLLRQVFCGLRSVKCLLHLVTPAFPEMSPRP